MIKRLFITDRKNNRRELKDFFDQEVGTRLEWEHGIVKCEYRLDNSEQFLAALSPSKNEIIVIQRSNSNTTDTLKIVNGDGTVKFYLKPPNIDSDRFTIFLEKVGEKEAFSSLRYIQLGERISNTTITVWIGFDWDWFEVKELNLTTGEFGESKMTGRL
jgi:hypothetical protein